jgi:hypothetical protein
MRCGECGSVYDVIWPAPTVAKRITQLLNQRPDPKTRNWLPGETIGRLVEENLEHGCKVD